MVTLPLVSLLGHWLHRLHLWLLCLHAPIIFSQFKFPSDLAHLTLPSITDCQAVLGQAPIDLTVLSTEDT